MVMSKKHEEKKEVIESKVEEKVEGQPEVEDLQQLAQTQGITYASISGRLRQLMAVCGSHGTNIKADIIAIQRPT
jgi:hypothetical protein